MIQERGASVGAELTFLTFKIFNLHKNTIKGKKTNKHNMCPLKFVVCSLCFSPVWLTVAMQCHHVPVYQKVSHVIVTDSQNSKNKTEVVINQIYPLKQLCRGSPLPWLKELGMNATESKPERGLRFPPYLTPVFWREKQLQTKEFPLRWEKECGGHMAEGAGLRSYPWQSTVFSLPPPQTPFLTALLLQGSPGGDRIGVKGS